MNRPAELSVGENPVPARPPSVAEFTAQFRASFRVLWLIAVGILREAGLAEDAVQEAAMIAFEKLNQFHAGTNFTAWMGQIVRNVALNRARRERRHRTGSVDPLDLECVAGREGDGPATAQHAQFDHRLVRALDGVGDVARACLLLRTVEGLEYSRIAVLLGIPEGTAMSHVHRTRQYLRNRLADVWHERTDGVRDGA